MNHSSMSSYMEHGFCFSWEPGLVWLHVASDILTGLAYFSIAGAMAYFVHKRRDEVFVPVFLLFALFILACGGTHFFAAYTVYVPEYWAEGYLKAFTALVSIAAAAVFIPKIPKAIDMPSLAKTLEEVQRLNQVQERSKERLQSLVNVFQYVANDVQDLLDFGLNEAIKMTASSYGYVYYYDEETKLFTLNSWSHGVMDSCSVRDSQSLYELDKTGIWGEAVRQRKPIMINDFAAADPLKKGYPDGHVHLTRFLTIPLLERGKIVAVVGVANKELPYDDSDVLQLSLLMDSVWRVAKRMQIEKDLHESEERVRLALTAANQGLYDLNVQTGEAIVSPEYARMLEYDPLDFVETNSRWRERLHPDDIENVTRIFEDYVSGKLPEYRVEFRQKVKSGEWIWILSLGKVVEWSSDGKPLRMLGTHTDITERIHKEKEIQEKNAELERFIYTASHDLKSPLVTISAFAGYLEADIRAGDELRIQQDLGYIRTATDKMGLMLAELLELSRVGRVDANLEEVSLHDIIQQTLQLVAGHVSERGVSVVGCESSLMLHGDRQRLVEIWQNLVENAVKYMGNQTDPTIELGLELLAGETVFFVRDNGIGIEKKYQDKIFGLFDKLDAGSEGSGLGLALVKRIVELYGGRIRVESEGEGRGSCFRFTLPGALVAEGTKTNGTGKASHDS